MTAAHQALIVDLLLSINFAMWILAGAAIGQVIARWMGRK